MDVNEQERLYIQHYTQTHIKEKEQLVVRKNMDVDEHEKLSNFTIGHNNK